MIAFVHASRRLATRTVARALDLFAQLREAMAEVRESRRKLEAELFRNRYQHLVEERRRSPGRALTSSLRRPKEKCHAQRRTSLGE
jgi:hypothetical protein